MRTIVASWLCVVVGCVGGKNDTPDGPDVDVDADADADADSDADTDTTPVVDADGDGSPAGVDCDDADPRVYPGAPDHCGDDRVTDCNRTSDDGIVTVDSSLSFDNLEDALAAASSGSEVLVCEGTYRGAFVSTVAVRLVAHGAVANTVLDGNNAGIVLSVPGGTEIVGVTLRGGRTTQMGGGLRQTSAGTLHVEDCVVSNNRARSGGGIAVAASGQAVLVNTRVESNTADTTGGGVWVGVGGSLDLTGGGLVTNNTASLAGGGVLVDSGIVTGGEVSFNVLTDVAYFYYDYGGGFYANGPSGGGGIATTGDCLIENVDVASNEGPGGGVSVVDGRTVMSGTLIHDNATPPGLYAGGIIVAAADLVLTGSEVYDNHGGQGGGGIMVSGTVTGGVFRDNTADDFGGGLAVVIGEVSGATFTGNTAQQGGGLLFMGGVVLDGVTMSDNRADLGGALAGLTDYYLPFGPTTLVLSNAVLTGNQALEGGALYTAWPVTLTDTILEDNTASVGAGMRVNGGAVTMTGGALVRNIAQVRGGGADVIGIRGTLNATNVDVGEGADENLPDDVWAGSAYTYGAAATFSCTNASCEP